MTRETDEPETQTPPLLATGSAAIRATLEDLERQLQEEQSRDRAAVPYDERMLAVGLEGARLLNILARTTRAQRVLEIGGSMGYSTMWLAEAVQAMGGHLIMLEQEPKKIAALRARIRQAEMDDVVELIPAGPSTPTLRRLGQRVAAAGRRGAIVG